MSGKDWLRGRAVREAKLTVHLPEVCARPARGERTSPFRPAISPEQRLVRKEMHEYIRGEIGQLPEGNREVLILGELGGLTDDEVAQALGISLANAKVRLHRARAQLKTAIAARCDFYRTELSCAPSSPACCPPAAAPGRRADPIADAVTFSERAPSKGVERLEMAAPDTGVRPMKNRFCTPCVMLALALVGTSIAFYDAYTLYNAPAAMVSAADQWLQRGRQ